MSRFIGTVIHVLRLGPVLWVTAVGAGESPAKALDARFLKALNASDLEATVACYADDAVIYLPDTFMARGKDAIHRSWEEFLDQFRISQAGISDANYIDMGGSLSVGWGGVEFLMTPVTGGEPIPLRARFTSVYEKRAGRWVFVSDHASLPMRPPAAKGE